MDILKKDKRYSGMFEIQVHSREWIETRDRDASKC